MGGALLASAHLPHGMSRVEQSVPGGCRTCRQPPRSNPNGAKSRRCFCYFFSVLQPDANRTNLHPTAMKWPHKDRFVSPWVCVPQTDRTQVRRHPGNCSDARCLLYATVSFRSTPLCGQGASAWAYVGMLAPKTVGAVGLRRSRGAGDWGLKSDRVNAPRKALHQI